MKVPYTDLGAQWLEIEDDAVSEIVRIMRGGKPIGDSVIVQLEEELAEFLGVKFCITLNSGTDALLIALMCLQIGRGDEVITVANSFIASTAAIAHVGATPVFVDVAEDHLINANLIESAITKRTKAIMPVHLEGKMCDMHAIKLIADKYGLAIIEDAAQSFGSNTSGIQPGQISNIACFSFHPLKNLNGIGDGGFIATNDSSFADRAKRLRSHGLVDRDSSVEFGFVSRLDSIQAAVLRKRLLQLPKTLENRIRTAKKYENGFKGLDLQIPIVSSQSFHTYHLFVIECNLRNKLQKELLECEIQTKVHYPNLICDQPAFINRFGILSFDLPVTRRQAKRILSLPIHQNLTDSQVDYVIECVNKILK